MKIYLYSIISYFVYRIGYLLIFNLMKTIFNRRKLVNYSYIIQIGRLLKTLFCYKVVLYNILRKTIYGYRDIAFSKREAILPGSVSHHYASYQQGKPVTMNYLTNIDSTKYKFEYGCYSKLLNINCLARNFGNEIKIRAKSKTTIKICCIINYIPLLVNVG